MWEIWPSREMGGAQLGQSRVGRIEGLPFTSALHLKRVSKRQGGCTA